MKILLLHCLYYVNIQIHIEVYNDYINLWNKLLSPENAECVLSTGLMLLDLSVLVK